MNRVMSKYTGKTVPELLALGHNLVTILSSEAGSKFGVTPAVVTALGLADTNLDAAENAQKAAMIAAKGSTVTKLAHKDDVASRIAAIQATVTANPIVTDADLVSLGFPPRRSGSTRPKLPNPVTGLIATPDTLGNVKIGWNRNDPRGTVSYIVEHSGDGGATWSLLDTTQRVSILASGYAPGIAAWFRVTATAAAGRATPPRRRRSTRPFRRSSSSSRRRASQAGTAWRVRPSAKARRISAVVSRMRARASAES